MFFGAWSVIKHLISIALVFGLYSAFVDPFQVTMISLVLATLGPLKMYIRDADRRHIELKATLAGSTDGAPIQAEVQELNAIGEVVQPVHEVVEVLTLWVIELVVFWHLLVAIGWI